MSRIIRRKRMCRFYGIYTIQDNPAPTTKDIGNSVVVSVRASTRVARSFKTLDRDGKETQSNYTSDFLDVYVSKRKTDGAVPKIASDIATPGMQFLFEGEMYRYKNEAGYKTRMKVYEFQYVGTRDWSKSPSGSRSSTTPTPAVKRPDTEAPAAQPVHAGVESDEDIPF